MMPKLKVDVSKLKSKGNTLINELANFLKEKANVKVEATANEIVLEGDEKFTINHLRHSSKNSYKKLA
jgi:hypothetical protein